MSKMDASSCESLPPAFVSSTSCTGAEERQGQVLDLSFRMKNSSDHNLNQEGARSRSDISSSENTREACLSISTSSSSSSTRPKLQQMTSSDSRASTNINQYGRIFTNGRPLPGDLRVQILQMSLDGIRPCEISRRLLVSHGCISKILNRYRKTGSLNPGQIGGSKPKVTTPHVIDRVRRCKAENPQIFAWEIRQSLLDEGVCNEKNIPSISSINRILRDFMANSQPKQTSSNSRNECTEHCVQISSEESCGSDGRSEQEEPFRRSDSVKTGCPVMPVSGSPKISSALDHLLYIPQYESSCSTVETKPKDLSDAVDWRPLWHAQHMPYFRFIQPGINYHENDWAARSGKLLKSNFNHLWHEFLVERNEMDSQMQHDPATKFLNQTLSSSLSLKSQPNHFFQAVRHGEMSDALKASELRRYVASPSTAVDPSLSKWHRADVLSVPTVRYASRSLNVPSLVPKISYGVGSHVAFMENSFALATDVPLDLTLPLRCLGGDFRTSDV